MPKFLDSDTSIKIEAIPELVNILNLLKNDLPDLTIDFLQTDLISDMVLELAEEKEQQECHFYSFKQEGMSVYWNGLATHRFLLYYQLEDDAIDRICSKLQEKLGKDKVANVNHGIGKANTCFEIDYQTFLTNILSNTKNFIAQHPERIAAYKLSHNLVIARYKELIQAYGFDFDTDIFEETLCRIVWNKNKNQKFASYRNTAEFPPVLDDIIKKYSWDYQTEEGEEFARYFSTKSSFNHCRQEAWLEINLEIKPEDAEMFLDYFNNIYPKSAELVTNINSDEGNDVISSRILVDNKILLSELFYKDFCEALEFTPATEINKYRQKSEYLSSGCADLTPYLEIISDSLLKLNSESEEKSSSNQASFQSLLECIENLSKELSTNAEDENSDKSPTPLNWEKIKECINLVELKFNTMIYLNSALKSYKDKFMVVAEQLSTLQQQAHKKTAIEKENDSSTRITLGGS